MAYTTDIHAIKQLGLPRKSTTVNMSPSSGFHLMSMILPKPTQAPTAQPDKPISQRLAEFEYLPAGTSGFFSQTADVMPPSLDYNLMAQVYDILERVKVGANYNPLVYDMVSQRKLFNNSLLLADPTTPFPDKQLAYSEFKAVGLNDNEIYALTNFAQNYGSNYLKNMSGNKEDFFSNFFNAPDRASFFSEYIQRLESNYPEQVEAAKAQSPQAGILGQLLQGEENINKLYDIALGKGKEEIQDWWGNVQKEAARSLVSRNLPQGGIAEKTYANLAQEGAKATSNLSAAIESERAKALQGLPYQQIATLEPIRQFEANLALQQQMPYLSAATNLLQGVPWGQTTTGTQTTPGMNPVLGFGIGTLIGQQLSGGQPTATAYLPGMGGTTTGATSPFTSSLLNPLLYPQQTAPYPWQTFGGKY